MPARAQQFDVAKLMTPPAGDIADHPLGGADAKVVVIEYLSPTCPHCKAFADQVFPQLKAEYIDTNKIQFIPRPFVRNVLDAVVFMLAEAAGEAKYHDVVDTFFKTQDQWATSAKPADAMLAIAQQLGFTKESYRRRLDESGPLHRTGNGARPGAERVPARRARRPSTSTARC